MQQRNWAPQGLSVSALGLGCMGMSAFYGATDEAESIAAIRRGLELGIFLDTAELYGPYTNEELVGKAVAGRRRECVIATKFGWIDLEDPSGPRRVLDGSPPGVRRSIDASLERLGTDYVDLYFQHRDPGVPIAETVGALGELVAEARCATSGSARRHQRRFAPRQPSAPADGRADGVLAVHPRARGCRPADAA